LPTYDDIGKSAQVVELLASVTLTACKPKWRSAFSPCRSAFMASICGFGRTRITNVGRSDFIGEAGVLGTQSFPSFPC
jgi:hypothetical protein